VTFSPRFAAFAAVAGALIGIALTPFMAAVWVYDPPANYWWANGSWVLRTFGPTLESAGALAVGFGIFENGSYEVYGKGFFLVYLGMVPVVKLVHGLNAGSEKAGGLEKWSWRVMYVALLVAALGDFTSYWGISLPGSLGETLWGAGFGVEILAFLVMIVAVTVYGVVSLRLRVIPIWASSLLIATIPIALSGLIATQYVPNALVVPLSLVWAAISLWLVRQPSRALSGVA